MEIKVEYYYDYDLHMYVRKGTKRPDLLAEKLDNDFDFGPEPDYDCDYDF